jgi:hypothetical protein
VSDNAAAAVVGRDDSIKGILALIGATLVVSSGVYIARREFLVARAARFAPPQNPLFSGSLTIYQAYN